jgi:NADH oxidase (H2O-forming)
MAPRFNSFLESFVKEGYLRYNYREVNTMQTKIFELRNHVWWIGVNDYDLRVFDVTMETKYGTTYNAYLVKGSEKTALIDTAKANFQDDYIVKLESLVDIKSIDYLVTNHTEPDHAGSIARLLQINPNIIIVATTSGIHNIKEIINHPFQHIVAKEDLVISLGDRTLRTFILPNLHWPDTMFTYLEEEKILFTCDFFGAHYAFEGVLAKNVENIEDYRFSLKHYFDCIMSPFKSFVRKALDKIEPLKIDFVATGHGPVVNSTNLREVTQMYREWSKVKTPNTPTLIVIPYASAYGYTLKMAGAVTEGLQDAFQGKVAIETYDLVTTPISTVVARIDQADAFLIGTTTILSDAVEPIWEVLIKLNPVTHGGKFASAFGSYGWSGEGVTNVMQRIKQLRMKTIDGLRLKFNPSQDQLEECREFGRRFGRLMQGME